MGKVLIKNARAIISCDKNDCVYYDTDILIDGPEIIRIDRNIADDGAAVINASGKLVYPGMVNTHHHFFQTFFRNLLSIDYPNMTVPGWLDKIYPLFLLVDKDVMYYSTMAALSDLIKHGCTCAFDHQYIYTNKTGKESIDIQMKAASELGIRYHAGRSCNTISRKEGSPVPEELCETTDEFLDECSRLISRYHDSRPFSMSQIVVAPCQPMNSYKETFVESLRFAREKGVRLHTHLGEGENAVMVERYGKRTLQWCCDIGFVGSDVWFAHGWELQPEEYKVMGETGTGLSHCPGPAILGGYPILDMKAMIKAGMLVSIGCDGCATNDSSSMLDSLRMAYLMQAYFSKSRGGCITPYDILKMATVNGAKTLGRDDLGSLEAGKAADLFMIDADVPELMGALHDPQNVLPRTGVTGPVWLTMINGKVVYQDGHLTGVDEEKITAEGEKVFRNAVSSRSDLF